MPIIIFKFHQEQVTCTKDLGKNLNITSIFFFTLCFFMHSLIAEKALCSLVISVFLGKSVHSISYGHFEAQMTIAICEHEV